MYENYLIVYVHFLNFIQCNNNNILENLPLTAWTLMLIQNERHSRLPQFL